MSKRVLSFYLTHRTVLCSKGEAFDVPRYPGSDAKENGSYTGQAFKEEGKGRYSRAVIEEVWIFKYVLQQSHPIVTSMFVLYQEKSVPDYVRGSGRSYSPQPGSRSCRKDGG